MHTHTHTHTYMHIHNPSWLESRHRQALCPCTVVALQVRLPWSKDASLRVRVWGEVEVDDGVPGGNSLAVTFGGWSFSLISPGQQAAQEIKLPLPRPRGTLAVTYCDESLRISRGGRGGIFVTSRAPDLSEPTG